MLFNQKQNGATFTWHVAKAKVSDAVIIVEEDVERVQSPCGLHQQTRPQRHHKPRRKILAKNCHNQSARLPFLCFPSSNNIFLRIVLCFALLCSNHLHPSTGCTSTLVSRFLRLSRGCGEKRLIVCLFVKAKVGSL